MADRLTPRERLARESDPEGDDRLRRRVDAYAPPPEKPNQKPKPKRKRREPGGLMIYLGRAIGTLTAIVGVLMLVGAAGAFMLYRHYAADLPDVDGLKSYQPRVMSRVFAGDASLMAELATERRIFVPFTAIPDVVKQAFVSAEDQNFWIHRGVDPLATARAAMFDLMHLGRGKRPVGASTITQQVAKNMLLDNSLSIARKAREAILAVRIENALSKERILELYLNEIYLGLQAYGVAAAAQAYFDKPLDQLTLGQAAFLATLPKAPNNYNPWRYPDAARDRRNWVLDRMLEDHAITQAQADAAKAEPIVPAQFHRPEPPQGYEWFAEEVRRRLVDKFGADTTTQGGLMVRTSMDPALQRTAEHLLQIGLMNYDRHHGGWRGAVGRVDPVADFRANWPEALAEAHAPPGMLPEWRLAVVFEESEGEARVGWVEHGGEQRTGAISLSDLGWARPVHDGHMGGSPARMNNVMQVGDLVMIEPPAATAAPALPPGLEAAPARGARPATAALAALRADRVQLRQIPKVQGALVSLDPTTGRVLALVGGWSFEQSQFNRATQAIRQPGSSFKPIVYLTALEQEISPSQMFDDGPITIESGGQSWSPGNYDGSTSGPVPMHVALMRSLNLVTVRIGQTVGIDSVAKNAIAFHVVDDMPRYLPTVLGAVGTTVLRMAGAYASFDEGGREVIPSLIDSVQDRDGHVVMRPQGRFCAGCSDPAHTPMLADDRPQIADPQSVFQLITMMRAVVEHGTGYEAGHGLNRQIAGKTGTSQDFNDAWFVGFTPDLVTAVWIGYDQPASLGEGETGGVMSAPIWHDFMQVALKDHPMLTFDPPDGVKLVTWGGSYLDAFKEGQEPGASEDLGTGVSSSGGSASASGDTSGGGAGPSVGSASQHGGVDTSMGGLY
ncbi:MAG TPA: PBP1A family penicillin-binding protein [Acidisphaera sp.]|nr:PBP1A family penicillin-binding protein [Acidisphaera sp.]